MRYDPIIHQVEKTDISISATSMKDRHTSVIVGMLGHENFCIILSELEPQLVEMFLCNDMVPSFLFPLNLNKGTLMLLDVLDPILTSNIPFCIVGKRKTTGIYVGLETSEDYMKVKMLL